MSSVYFYLSCNSSNSFFSLFIYFHLNCFHILKFFLLEKKTKTRAVLLLLVSLSIKVSRRPKRTPYSSSSYSPVSIPSSVNNNCPTTRCVLLLSFRPSLISATFSFISDYRVNNIYTTHPTGYPTTLPLPLLSLEAFTPFQTLHKTNFTQFTK